MCQNRFWHLPPPQYFGISQQRQVLLAFACTKRGPSQKLSKRKGIVILYFFFFIFISVFTTNQKLLLILGNMVWLYIYWYILILQLLLTLNPKTIFTTNKQKPKNHIAGILPITYSRGQDFILCYVI
jgi:hypothetical protein